MTKEDMVTNWLHKGQGLSTLGNVSTLGVRLSRVSTEIDGSALQPTLTVTSSGAFGRGRPRNAGRRILNIVYSETTYRHRKDANGSAKKTWDPFTDIVWD